MALVQKQFGDLITFTRSSAGGRFNERGIYEMVPANQPRFDFDPVTLKPRGILIEEGRTNQLTFSRAMIGGSWVFSRASGKPGLNALDGQPSLLIIEEKDSTLPHEVSCTAPITSLSPQCVSVLVKAAGSGSKRNLRLNLTSNSVIDGSSQTTFDLEKGSIVQQQPQCPAFMWDMGYGWWRVGFTYTPVRSQTAGLFFTLSSDIGGPNYTGDGLSGLNLCWPQLEAGTFPTSYIPTAVSQISRSSDLPQVNLLSPWYNQAESTVYTEFNPGERGLGGTCVSAWFRDKLDASKSLVAIRKDGSMNYITGLITNLAGVVQTQITVTSKPVPSGALAKAALSYAGGMSALSVNGSSVIAGSVTEMPSPNQLILGTNGNGQQHLNGYLRAIRYYPRRLSNAELEAMTK